ncbi:hypothetical protein L0337_03045 [candidate division KSB1 bacterium]|nr:hypothetical protein [candidate division KSB1 bacterium]
MSAISQVLFMLRVCKLCGFIWIIIISPLSYAQTGATDRAAEIKRALQQAEYQIAADLADSAITHFREHAPAQLAEIHAFRALIFFEQGSSARGEEHLMLALQLDPGLQLDPIFFSPQIRERLEALRPQIVTLDSANAPAVRYIVVPDPRLEAAWRSLLLPGWGQRFKGQKTKGRLFTISAAALAGATLASHILRERAENKYLQAEEEADIKSRYDTLNRYHLLRNNLALALGVVWGAAALDALILCVEPKATRLGIIPSLEKNSPPVYLALQISL